MGVYNNTAPTKGEKGINIIPAMTTVLEGMIGVEFFYEKMVLSSASLGTAQIFSFPKSGQVIRLIK